MTRAPGSKRNEVSPQVRLALSMLASYLFFLARRPVSSSNTHYLAKRLAGLKSLGRILEDSGQPELAEAAKRLRAIQPGSFATLNYSLQFQLQILQRPIQIPPEYIVTADAPEHGFFSDVRRVLLILGPAIGIGDEIILFPLPARLKTALGDVETVVMSGYAGLWERVRGVDRAIGYSTHAEILDALEGSHASGPFDIVMLADFEKPGLAPAICRAGGVERYIELSLGAQCAIAVDNRERRVACTNMPLDAPINYYAAMDRLSQWLGIHAAPNDRYDNPVCRQPRQNDGISRVFVSPFTSKYEPSAIYWGQLLATLGQEHSSRPVEFVLDPGSNLQTERFSALVARAAGVTAAKGVTFRVARGASARTLRLAEVFTELEQCDAAICADSFLAHAAPLFGLTTLVIAKAGLENWRTPSARSYYFYLEQPLEELSAAIRTILRRAIQSGNSGQTEPVLDQPGASRLDTATRSLAAALGNGGFEDGHGLNGHLVEFLESYADVIGGLASWPRDCQGLLTDVPYASEWRPAEEPSRRLDRAGWRSLQQRVERWEQTNLRKFLRLIHERPASISAGTV
jgi:hypothetical protein